VTGVVYGEQFDPVIWDAEYALSPEYVVSPVAAPR
jgi:hypothetical protein